MKKFLKSFFFTAIFAFGISSACANDRTTKYELEIKSFTIIPVAEPDYFSLQSGWPTPIWAKIRNNAVGDGMTESIKKDQPELGKLLQNEVANFLKAKGMVEVAAPESTRPARKGRVIGDDDLKTASDAIILIYFNGQGVSWRRSESAYVPLIYITFCVTIKQVGKKCVLQNTAQYGGDATKDSNLEYMSGLNEKWSDIEAIGNAGPSLSAAFKNGTKKIADGVSNNIAMYGVKEEAIALPKHPEPATKESVAVPQPSVGTLPAIVHVPPVSPTVANQPESNPAVTIQKSADTSDLAGKMRTLDKLHKEGLINQQEFDAKKQELLKRL